MTEGRVLAYVGLGANVGDAPRTLSAAVRALDDLPEVALRGVSRLYVTRPVGMTDQPEFHNAAVALEVSCTPDASTAAVALLITLKSLERTFGRRERKRWGPRELDLDLLVFGGHQIRVERPQATRSADPGRADARWLEVPHPAAQERLFVLAPIADLAPDLVPPGWTRSVETVRRERVLAEGDDAARPVGTWKETAWDAEETPGA